VNTQSDVTTGPQWVVGDVTVTRVAEVTLPVVPTDLLPFASAEALARHPWLRPWALTESGHFPLSVHSLCIESHGQKVIVDTCFGLGPLPERMASRCNDGSFLEALGSIGFGRDDVDVVISTHLHVDHVGWNTVPAGGRREPTFRRARYLISKPEFDYWSSASSAERASRAVVEFDASVMTLAEHGAADLVAPDHIVSDTLRLIPTPGHSPGHVSVHITSGGEQALITGDCVHSPVQFAEPDWHAGIDVAPAMSRVTRRKLVADYADTDVLVIGTHFAPPTAGYLITTAGGVQFRPLSSSGTSPSAVSPTEQEPITTPKRAMPRSGQDAGFST
jgi:glyoxylase-like metal-dependent hydrolase (beta-lactamase superfamily II)